MIKLIVVLYVICFGIYILFTRQPDYFDGVTASGTIHFTKDSAGKSQPYAFYSVNDSTYSVIAAYLFRSYKENDHLTMIYEESEPSKGAVYSVWGYWIRWGEVLFSIAFLIVLFRVAIAITSNPTPEALIKELEGKPSRRGKYDS
jgi:hypothetical protein